MNDSSLKTLFTQGRSDSPPSPVARRQARLATLIPWLLLGGFFAVIGVLFGDRLRPGLPVEVETVVTLKAAAPAASGAVGLEGATELSPVDPWEAPMAFQASGWIEPDPLPIKVTALVDGFIEEVLVLEGEAVKKGQVLARLIDDDFKLDLATAASERDAAKAEAEANEQAILAVGAQVATLAKQVSAGKLRLLELEDRRTRLGGAGGGAVSEEEIIQSGLRVQTYAGELEALEVSGAELESERARLTATRRVYEAKIAGAETEVARHQLALDRTEIRSPVDGVVMRLFAVPGRKSMLAMDEMDSSTIANLYRPDHLQARIDVPLEEAAAVAPGQAVRVRSNFLPDRVIRGTVTRIVGEADLQRNTLQVKVAIRDPDPRLRPEMLCRAEFITSTEGGGKADAESPSQASARASVYVPVRALVDHEGDSARVWVIARSGERVESRALSLGREERDGYHLVVEGLLPGDRVVLDPGAALSEGLRVKPLTENPIP